MLFVINFKTYKEGTGKNAVELAKDLESASKDIVIAAQNADLYRLKHECRLKIFAQNVDPIVYGSNTGKDLAECLTENGASGSVINHAENRVSAEVTEKCIARCREAGLISLVCADTPASAEKIAALKPDIIAIEPPELIGGTISVSKARPEIITDTVKKVKSVNKTVKILCGAGISSGEDVAIAEKLGCDGVFVSSAVVKSQDPAAKIKEFMAAIKH
jgi:triosephosphate isomerase